MRVRFPHPFVLLVGGILVAMVLTWTVPAGQYDRHEDPVTGKSVVTAGTYHSVERHPVGLFAATVSISDGLIKAGDIIFFVFLVGGALTVVEKTGAFRRAVDLLADRLQNRRALMIPVVCLVSPPVERWKIFRRNRGHGAGAADPLPAAGI